MPGRPLRHLLYPSVVNVRAVLPWVLVAALTSGAYGAVHNQLTYTLSREYFTRLKFDQFSYLDWGLPERVFAAAIGFQAAWPIGALVGWWLASYHSQRKSLSAFGMVRTLSPVFAGAVVGLILGGVYGYYRAHVLASSDFLGWERELEGELLDRFTVAACIHNGGYLGVLVGAGFARFLIAPAVVRRAQRQTD